MHNILFIQVLLLMKNISISSLAEHNSSQNQHAFEVTHLDDRIVEHRSGKNTAEYRGRDAVDSVCRHRHVYVVHLEGHGHTKVVILPSLVYVLSLREDNVSRAHIHTCSPWVNLLFFLSANVHIVSDGIYAPGEAICAEPRLSEASFPSIALIEYVSNRDREKRLTT